MYHPTIRQKERKNVYRRGTVKRTTKQLHLLLQLDTTSPAPERDFQENLLKLKPTSAYSPDTYSYLADKAQTSLEYSTLLETTSYLIDLTLTANLTTFLNRQDEHYSVFEPIYTTTLETIQTPKATAASDLISTVFLTSRS